MTKLYDFTQVIHLQPALTVRRIGAGLLARMMIVCLFAVGLVVAQAQNSADNQTLSDTFEDFSEQYPLTSMRFAPCAEDPSLECGRVTLPVDYTKPFGQKFDMAVVRARA